MYTLSYNCLRYLVKGRYTSVQFITQKMKFSIKDFFSKYDQIRSFMRIWSHLLKKSLMENFIFCAVIRATIGIVEAFLSCRH